MRKNGAAALISTFSMLSTQLVGNTFANEEICINKAEQSKDESVLPTTKIEGITNKGTLLGKKLFKTGSYTSCSGMYFNKGCFYAGNV